MEERNTNYLKLMKEQREFKVLSGWRTWSNRSASSINDGYDAPPFVTKFAPWEPAEEPVLLDEGDDDEDQTGEETEEEQPDETVPEPEPTPFEEAVDKPQIKSLGWDNEEQNCQLLQTNGYMRKLPIFNFAGSKLTYYKFQSEAVEVPLQTHPNRPSKALMTLQFWKNSNLETLIKLT